jgi:UDP-N-acetylglucosamine--N-acetylmuramyl-(pentapeptide) pyrophosphoryl-undecaprenol N-acetylglucosamine transferase
LSAQALAPLIVVAAGGTGGHLFPAEATAIALAKRGAAVDLATDERAVAYAGSFPAGTIHTVPSATFKGRDPVSVLRAASRLGLGFGKAFGLFGRLQPAAVIGFGGYPTIPPILAARMRGIATLIHEQNGVMGRANRLLAPRVTAIAIGFPEVAAAPTGARLHHTGNPVRPAVVAAAAQPFPDYGADVPLRILVFGGSQGAQVMADIVPAAMAKVEPALWPHLTVTQQARAEDVARVRAAYGELGIAAEVAPFFNDLPNRMAQAHLVVSRSGASTVAELAAIGRPAILVPLPHALDQDQRANAGFLQDAGGGILIEQGAFTPDRLAAEISELAANRSRLAAMAAAARTLGRLDAADRLADLILEVATAHSDRLRTAT